MDTKKHQLSLLDAKHLTISGVNKVISATPSALCVQTDVGQLLIGGQNIAVEKLDVASGVIEAEGEFVQFKYSQPKEKGGIVKRIFK